MVMWLMNPWIRLIKSMNEVLLQLLWLEHNRNRSVTYHNFGSWSLQFNRDGLWPTDCLPQLISDYIYGIDSPRVKTNCGDHVVIECQLLWIVLFNRKNFNQYFSQSCFTYPRIERGDVLICNLMMMWYMHTWTRVIKSMNEVLLQLLGLEHNRNHCRSYHNFGSWSLQLNTIAL